MNITHGTHKAEPVGREEAKRLIFDFLSAHPIGVLATVDPNGDPHAAALYYSIDNEFNITFTTKQDTRKHDNLRHNDHAMLLVFESESQTTVQITGVAEDITDTAEAAQAFRATQQAAMATSETGIAPISKLYAGPYVAYKLRPVQLRAAVFVRPESGGYELYETIDF